MGKAHRHIGAYSSAKLDFQSVLPRGARSDKKAIISKRILPGEISASRAQKGNLPYSAMSEFLTHKICGLKWLFHAIIPGAVCYAAMIISRYFQVERQAREIEVHPTSLLFASKSFKILFFKGTNWQSPSLPWTAAALSLGMGTNVSGLRHGRTLRK